MWSQRRASHSSGSRASKLRPREGVHGGAVEDGLLAVEADELAERKGVPDEVGGGVLEAELVRGCDRLADVC